MAGLLDVPGLGAFLQARQLGEQTQAREIGGLAQLLQAQNAQQAQPVKMDLLRAQAANEAAKPEDRKIALENNRQAALSRIQQAAGQFEQTMQLKLRSITNAEEKAAWDREYQQGRLALEAVAKQQGAERLFYDTGIRTQVPTVGGGSPGEPVAAPAPTAAPTGLEAILPTGQSPAAVSARVNASFPPAAQAAAAAEGADIQRRELMPNGGGMLPSGPLLAQGRVPVAPAPGALPGGFQTVAAPGQPAHAAAPQPLAQVTPAALPAAPVRPLPGRELDRVEAARRIAQDKAGTGVGLTSEALDLRAEQYLSGNPNAMSNLGRGAQGDQRIIQITNRAAELLRERGGNPQEIGRRMAEYKANAASLSQLTKSYDAVTAFEQTAVRNGEQLLKLADKADVTGVPAIERWIRAGRQATGDPDVAQFNAQLQVYRTEAARILTNPNLTGQLTDAARREIEAFLGPGASAQQIRGVVGLLKNDFENRRKTLENQINTTRDRIERNVGAGSAAPATEPAPPQRRATDGQPRNVLRFDAQGNQIQ